LPSINAISIMAGAAAGGIGAGMLGWRSSADNEDLDTNDRAAFTASSAIAGLVGGGAALAAVGPYRIGMGLKAAVKGTYSTGKSISKINSVARSLGAGKAPWLKGPMKVLGLTAATVGVMAYSARSNPQTAAYASRDETGQAEYTNSSLRDRMNTMGAVGDIVLGMHNKRHG
jgi:hypothetical protein